MELKVIAYARNGHTDKFGIPRQSREESPILTRIVFEPEYSVPEALRGIEGYSHLWLIWGFSSVRRDDVQCTKDEAGRTTEWSPTVRPPRLGGNRRMGVFATRSPFRPNPLGLSSVRLVEVRRTEGRMELVVSGADVLDGTPIYDIKPYLSFSDSHEEARNGFAEETKDYRLEVDWSRVEGAPSGFFTETSCEYRGHDAVITRLSRANHALLEAEKSDIEYILSQDPRPGYQNDPEREYKMDYAGWRVTFNVQRDDGRCTKEQCTMCKGQCTKDKGQCTKDKGQCTMYKGQWAMYKGQCTKDAEKGIKGCVIIKKIEKIR